MHRVHLIDNIKLAIDANGTTGPVWTRIDGGAIKSVVWATSWATNIVEAKGLTVCHDIGATIDSGTKLVKGTSIALTEPIDKDADENVMILG